MKLIVSAHGMLAKEVVNSAGMVFGAIDDLDIVTFVPGENAETLKARYKELIDGYKEDEEILFLVDLFGGSPYNAAFETVIGQDRMDVITGLSLPMLIDVVGIRTMEEDIKAEFKHGILKLFVPKKEVKPAVEEKKYISIEG